MKPPSPLPEAQEVVWRGEVSDTPAVRADKYLSEILSLMSRSQLKARKARVFVNGKEEKLSKQLKTGMRIEVRWIPEPAHSFEPEALDVSLLYEDDHVFVFDKAQGMVTHPANGHWKGTLANAALWLDAERRGRGGAPGTGVRECAAPRGGIVHRLDKDTSGVIIVVRTAQTHEFLASQFKNRTTRKEYWAIVSPPPALKSGHIENHLSRDRNDRKKFAESGSGGKRAVTEYRVLAQWSIGQTRSYALVALSPRTGRTHQLRVHMAGLGSPVLGDPVYGKKDPLFPEATLMLHARRLKILLPGETEARTFKSPLPSRFKALIGMLGKKGKPLTF